MPKPTALFPARPARLIVAAVALALVAGGCTQLKGRQGYIVDPVLTDAITPGVDNRESVEKTLGRPTFVSQYGEPTWYYVSSNTGRAPFSRPRVIAHQVLAVKFDGSGNVTAADRTGIDKVVFLSPESDKTPTLGRDRSFLEDLFGNIGTVGTGMGGGGGGGGNTGGGQ